MHNISVSLFTSDILRFEFYVKYPDTATTLLFDGCV